MNGTVFNIQRFSLYDGDGIRTVVFLKGCPLNCIWCHNPEGKKPKPQIMYDAKKCIGCGECANVCPSGLHNAEKGIHTYSRESCTGCGECAGVCPTTALSVTGKIMTDDEVIEEVLRDMKFYRESGGGLTLSGGEPMMQADFAISVLKKAKDHSIRTCIETCGFCDSGKLMTAAEYLDQILFDYKATGDELHKKLTGQNFDKIEKNLSLLDRAGKNIILRCPIVTSCNDNEEHYDGIAQIAAKYENIREIQLELYHKLGISKSEKLGEVPSYDGEAPDRTKMNEAADRIAVKSRKKCKVV